MTAILVVDDEPDLEALVLQRFRRERQTGLYSFRFARDGVEALDVLDRHRDIAMVLADINMPRMDGLALLSALQQWLDPPATVIISAYGDMSNIRAAMNNGAFDFLTKPIDFNDLELTLNKTLRYVRDRRAMDSRRQAAEQAHASLARYFSPSLARRLADQSRTLNLGGDRREISIVFTDVTGFTSLTEMLAPQDLAAVLNPYLAGLADIAFAHDGAVAKVMGDGMMVLFGAPDHQPDHASRALTCALSMDAFAEEFRRQRRQEGFEFGTTRLGLHSGTALVGDFGGGRHFDYTAYGDAVNVAQRLEEANKTLGTRILVSASLAEQVPTFRGRRVGELVLRGRVEPMPAFEPEMSVMRPATFAGSLPRT